MFFGVQSSLKNSVLTKKDALKREAVCFEEVLPVGDFPFFLWGSGVYQEIEGHIK